MIFYKYDPRWQSAITICCKYPTFCSPEGSACFWGCSKSSKGSLQLTRKLWLFIGVVYPPTHMLNMTQIYRGKKWPSPMNGIPTCSENQSLVILMISSLISFLTTCFIAISTAPWQVEPFCESKAAHPTGPHPIFCASNEVLRQSFHRHR